MNDEAGVTFSDDTTFYISYALCREITSPPAPIVVTNERGRSRKHCGEHYRRTSAERIDLKTKVLSQYCMNIS